MSRALRTGVLSGTVLLAAFIANALLKPEEYRATSLVTVEFTDPKLAAEASTRPLEAARLLRQSVFRGGALTDGKADLEDELAIQSVDGLTFVITAQHRDAAAAKDACMRVADRAAQKVPEAFNELTSGLRSRDVALREAEQLAAFAARHPEVVASTSSPPAEVVSEWRNLLRRAASAAPSNFSPSKDIVQKVNVEQATVTIAPEQAEQRRLLFLLGLIASVGTGIAVALSRRALELDSEPRGPASTSQLAHSAPPVEEPPPAPELPTELLAPPITSPIADPIPAGSPSGNVDPKQRIITILPPPIVIAAPAADSAIATGPASLSPVTDRMTPAGASEGAADVPEYLVFDLHESVRPGSVSSFPVSRTTRALGSPVPPADDSASPPNRAGARSASGRYSYVNAPVPQQLVPVRQKDVSATFNPDPSLRPMACAPLRRELYALGVQQCFILGVTCVPGCHDQKARFAAELSLLLSQPGHARVLLIDADFERPRIRELLCLEVPSGDSFSEQLYRGSEQQEVEGWSVLRCRRSLHVLPEVERGSPGLSLSGRVGECLRDVRVHYDFIVLDGPPGSAFEDTRALANLVDGAFLVSPDPSQASPAAIAELFTGKRLVKAVRVG